MHRIVTTFVVMISIALAVNATVPAGSRLKRQSDQRIAELETLLALQKYGLGSRRVGGRNSPAVGYGLINFDYIGRKKKSVDESMERGSQPGLLARPDNNEQNSVSGVRRRNYINFMKNSDYLLVQ